MKFGIIAAMEQELAVLLNHLENREDKLILGTTYHTGKIGQHDVVLVQSGVGKVMAAMAVTVLANDFAVDVLVNTGSAGAVADAIAVGEVVLADKLVYHDVDLTAFGYAYGQMSMQPLYFECDQALLQRFKEALSGLNQTSHTGLIATGDSFIASDSRLVAIKEQFPQVLAVEMEGAAIAQAARACQLPFLVVRAMSDTADHQATMSFDAFIVEAGKRSAEVILTVLNHKNA